MKQHHWLQITMVLLIISASCVIYLASWAFASEAQAATARFTGNFTVSRTSTGRAALNCEYRAGGQTYWYTVPGSRCPLSIQVP